MLATGALERNRVFQFAQPFLAQFGLPLGARAVAFGNTGGAARAQIVQSTVEQGGAGCLFLCPPICLALRQPGVAGDNERATAGHGKNHGQQQRNRDDDSLWHEVSFPACQRTGAKQSP